MTNQEIIIAIQQMVGAENTVTEHENLICYLFNAGPRRQSEHLPLLAVLPHTTEQVSQVLRFANEQGIPVITRGRASGLSENTRIEQPGAIILSTDRFQGITVDPETLTVVAGAGVITSEIKKAAADHGLFYPPDPASYEYSTIGGNVATDAGGLQCVKYGTTKNYVLGMEVVLATGDILRVGGKCVKDVTGYNLVQLFTGSEGTLGVITEVTLKLIPLPEASKSLLVIFDNVRKAGEAISRIMISGVVPSTMEFMDNTLIRAVEDMEPSGFPVNAECMLLIQVDGLRETLDRQVEKIRHVSLELNAVDIRVANTDAEVQNIWKARRICLSALTRRVKSRLSGDPAAPINKLADVLGKLKELEQRYGILIATYGHAGDGNVHPCLCFNTPEERERAVNARNDFYEYMISIGGTASAEHGVGREKVKYMQKQLGTTALAMMIGIKKLFDPQNILNPGCIFGEHLHE